MKDALGYYDILHIEQYADVDTIKKAYRDLAKIWHPDYNKDPNATDIFQQLSVAYDILSNDKSRLVYDLLSLVYYKENYPDTDSMTPFVDEQEGVNIRAVKLEMIKAWFSGYKISSDTQIVNYTKAIRLNFLIAFVDWLIGWWHPKAFFANIKAISGNFLHPISSCDTFRVFIHNMIAYAKDGHYVEATKCGLLAKRFASAEDAKLIDRFLQTFNVKTLAPKPWNIALLKAVQLVIPLILVILFSFPLAKKYTNLSESELWNIFAAKDEIDYYQQVKFGNGGESVDDVVVGKIISIPVDKSDNSKLYHLIKTSKIMYGPSSDFDTIKTLAKSTTVRLTGYTPDNVWARVMIDNGETGFVYFEDIAQGIGSEIPFGSAIID